MSYSHHINWNSICSSPAYWEMNDTANIGFPTSLDFRVYLFGKCDLLARLLSDMYGYKIVAYVQLNDPFAGNGYDATLIHAFNVWPGGQGAFADWAIDARGIMKDIPFEVLMEPFEDSMEYIDDAGNTCRAFPLQFDDSLSFSNWAGTDGNYLEDKVLSELSGFALFDEIYKI